MNFKDSCDFFKKLIAETNHKSEIRVYKNFMGILFDLESKNLTEIQLQAIHKKIDTLNLKANPVNRKKYFILKLREFKKYLQDKFSFISEGYYTALGMSLGMSFGTSFGVTFGVVFEKIGLGITFGMIFGMLLGLIIGTAMDANAKKEGRVLKTALH